MAQSKTQTLNAKKRDRLGSRYARRVRAVGGLPAVLYGHGQSPAALTLDAKEAFTHIAEGRKVFTISIEGEASDTALLKDIQFDHLGSNIIHVDLARVSLDERVEVNAHVNLVGDAVGLKTAGAVLLHPMTEITVRCLVTDITDHLDVDISHLDVGKVLHASDVPMPPGFELITDPHAVLASIQVTVAEVEPEAAPVEGEAAEPEVLTERKSEEGEAGAKDEKDKGGGKKKE